MGAMTAGNLSAFAPDFLKAKIAAAKLFKLFDSKPSIDSQSDEGLHPVSWYSTHQGVP